jgi:nitrate reductase gamma subunit
MTLTVIYAILFYLATVLFIAGIARKVYIYAKTPAPLKIPTTPAPTTNAGVVWRIIKEITVFQSLFKANKWIWLFGWLFHFGLLLVLLRHLRYFIESPWFWVDLIQPFGKYGSIAMVIGLGGLWARRFLVDRIRYISSPSDHLMLALLLAIGISGMLMTFFVPINVVALKGFVMGLMTFSFQPLPSDALLLIHLALVAVLLIVFPISKLLHAPGLFFAPTRVQRDNPREQRHVAGWTAESSQG